MFFIDFKFGFLIEEKNEVEVFHASGLFFFFFFSMATPIREIRNHFPPKK